MKLEDITKDLNLSGIEPSQIVTVVATVPLRDESLQVIYRTPRGANERTPFGSFGIVVEHIHDVLG